MRLMILLIPNLYARIDVLSITRKYQRVSGVLLRTIAKKYFYTAQAAPADPRTPRVLRIYWIIKLKSS